MNGIYLLLGSNLGDRLSELSRAAQLLQSRDIEIKACSSVYETEPWGLTDQPNFLNIVLKVDCSHVPQNLLKACLAIEEQMGRKRVIKWGARTIDIDILFFHDEIIASSNLEIPHPGIIDRRFTLLPLSEIAGDQIHPVTNETIKQLLDKHTDDQSCKRTELLLIP